MNFKKCMAIGMLLLVAGCGEKKWRPCFARAIWEGLAPYCTEWHTGLCCTFLARSTLDLSNNSNPFPRLVSGEYPLKGLNSRNQRFNKGFNGLSIRTTQFYDLVFTIFFLLVWTFTDT